MKIKEKNYILNLLKREKGYANEYEYIFDNILKKIMKMGVENET